MADPTSNPTNTGEIMDLAARADRRALFAALQRALIAILDETMRRDPSPDGIERYERQMGYVRRGLAQAVAELGSPEELAARERNGGFA